MLQPVYCQVIPLITFASHLQPFLLCLQLDLSLLLILHSLVCPAFQISNHTLHSSTLQNHPSTAFTIFIRNHVGMQINFIKKVLFSTLKVSECDNIKIVNMIYCGFIFSADFYENVIMQTIPGLSPIDNIDIDQTSPLVLSTSHDHMHTSLLSCQRCRVMLYKHWILCHTKVRFDFLYEVSSLLDRVTFSLANTNALRAAVGKLPHIKGFCRDKVRAVGYTSRTLLTARLRAVSTCVMCCRTTVLNS